MAKEEKFTIGEIWSLLKETLKNWQSAGPWRLGAIVAYYAIIALPGLLVIVITIAGFFFGQEGVRLEIQNQLNEVIGSTAAARVGYMVEEAMEADDTTFANIFGIATLLFGATGLFFHLQRSINEIYGITIQAGVKKIALDRVVSFGMVIVMGFLMLVSLLLTSALGIARNWLLNFLPEETVYLFEGLNWLVSFFIVSVIFAFIFKFLPDVKVTWKPVIVGALITTVLYVISEYLIGLYFQNSDEGAIYGAAGFVILLMFWITYASLIMFFGAALVKVYAKRYGYILEPGKYGEWQK
jgi:membrane protein